VELSQLPASCAAAVQWAQHNSMAGWGTGAVTQGPGSICKACMCSIVCEHQGGH
jgi:hypothetical protein